MPNSHIHIEDITNMLAYLHARQGLDTQALQDSLEMLLEDYGTWNISELLEQIDERSRAIAGALHATAN